MVTQTGKDEPFSDCLSENEQAAVERVEEVYSRRELTKLFETMSNDIAQLIDSRFHRLREHVRQIGKKVSAIENQYCQSSRSPPVGVQVDADFLKNADGRTVKAMEDARLNAVGEAVRLKNSSHAYVDPVMARAVELQNAQCRASPPVDGQDATMTMENADEARVTGVPSDHTRSFIQTEPFIPHGSRGTWQDWEKAIYDLEKRMRLMDCTGMAIRIGTLEMQLGRFEPLEKYAPRTVEQTPERIAERLAFLEQLVAGNKEKSLDARLQRLEEVKAANWNLVVELLRRMQALESK